VALAFTVYTFAQTGVVYLIAYRLSRFRWCGDVLKLGGMALLLIVTGFLINFLAKRWWWWCFMLLLIGWAGMISLRGIATRLGSAHRHVQMISKLPGLGILLRTSNVSSTLGVSSDEIS
jgi:type II secretory pathway component PulF